MTDEEIIKALKCCAYGDVYCKGCSYAPRFTMPKCKQQCTRDALNLVNRLKGEIYELQETIIMGRFTSPTAVKARQSWYRQNSENIKRLRDENERLQELYSLAVAKREMETREFTEALKTIEAEAVKLFWNELKKRNTMDERIVSVASGDNLLKELTGAEDNGNTEKDS